MGCGASASRGVPQAVASGASHVAKEVEEVAKEGAAAAKEGAEKLAQEVKEEASVAKKHASELLGEAKDSLLHGAQEATFTREIALTCKVIGAESGHFPELSPEGEFGMPALQAKPDFGICMSGGGMRATSCSVGVIRALHAQGILSQARYLSTTSGASWLNSCMSFAQLDSLAEFLGPYVPPSELTPAALQQVGEKGRSYMASIADSHAMQHFLKDMLGGAVGMDWWRNETGAWTEAISTVFLEPFDLGDLKKSTVTAMGTRGQVDVRVQECAAGMGLDAVYAYRDQAQLPFPILTQNVLQPNDSRVFFPFEWTPLYAGMPAAMADEEGRQYGGGWVEPIGLNSLVTKAPEGPVGPNGVDIELKSVGPSSLGEAAGISSAYIPYSMALGKGLAGKAGNLLLGGQRQQYWCPKDYEAKYMCMSDGGGTDCPGIMPLLRRKVKRVLCWLSSRVDPTDPVAFAASCMMAPMFGQYPGSDKDKPNAALQNQLQQVFPSSAWDALYKNASARFTSGGPVWHRARMPVSANAFQGVEGGWEVDVMFVWNCSCLNFTEQLPEDTVNLIASQKAAHEEKLKESAVLQPFVSAGLATFPLLKTQHMNYSPELIVAMSNLSAWAINSLSSEINKLLAA